MGAKIKNEATEDIDNIKTLSQNLFKFFTDDKNLYEITNNEFGGELIYAGGDDILALMPVKKDDKTFLGFLETLDKRFKQKVGDDVSLSFGVNIVYQKYPLRDAIKSAFDLLYSAKATTSNSVTIKTTKHSGQFFQTNIALNSEVYQSYKKIVDGILKEEILLPHSIHHSLKRYQSAIVATYERDRSTKALFETIFNDERDSKTKQGLQELQKFLDILKPTTNEEFDKFFSKLSIVKFLRGDRDE